jgi:hypothetical protein
MNFQTDLIVNFMDGSQMFFADVHPDNRYQISEGLLTFEDNSGEKIHYLPAVNVKNFFTVCVPVHD